MKLDAFVEEMRPLLKGSVRTEVRLDRFTTYRLGGPAALLIEPDSADDLRVVSEALAAHDAIPVLPLGRGSNLVISDHGFPGVVIRLGASFSWMEPWQDGDALGVSAGAATSLPQVANWAARRSLSGLEWAISIPGSVGGGVRMNAGAHGGEVADRLVLAHIWDLRSGVADRPVSDLGYSYRRSNLTEQEVVVDATFRLVPGEAGGIRTTMESFRRHRAETQPGALQNAGSVFKNPPGDSAGRLVESAGLKGFSVGGASVSELHANFFIARDGSTAQDVFNLVQEVRRRVKEHSGVELEPEIRFIGTFQGLEEAG